MIAMPKRPLGARVTAAEFLDWPGDPTGQIWQLIDGQPVAMAPASQIHGAIQGEIGALLRNHLRAHRRHCRVIVAPGVQPRVRAASNVRVPDLTVTCEPADRREHLVATPVLLIEILSPSNDDQTWANVWAYTTIPSVVEILIVESTAVEAQLLRRLADGSWPAEFSRITDPGAPVRLDSIAAEFALGAFYETTDLMPPPG